MSLVQVLDDEMPSAVTLVVDGNETSRRTLAGLLRSFGVRRVDQFARPQDARSAMENRRYDIVLCDYHFPGEAMTGQELLDDLRQSGLLSLATVVVMVSDERDAGRIAEAAEAALDAYLIKPHTPEALRTRLAKARERKRALAEVIDLVAREAWDPAATLAEQQAAARGLAWLQAARIAADLHLRLGRPHDSARLLEDVLKSGAVPWARLGLARAQTESGTLVKARRTLESLIADLPGYTDAYDVMGRVLLEQGQPDAALEMLRQSTRLTPNSVARLVKLGLVAFYYGQADEAADMLDRAAKLGNTSRAYDLQGLVLLATLQFDRGDARGLGQSLQRMGQMRETALESPRLRRFEAVMTVLLALLEHRPVPALKTLQSLLDEAYQPDFDFEAATNLLTVLARLHRTELHLDDLDHHVERLATRFAVSHTTCGLMCAAMKDHPEQAACIQRAYERICAMAEDAIGRSVAGEPGAAAEALLALASQNFNAKLMDLAQHTVIRHHARIADADALMARIDTLLAAYRSYGAQVRVARVDDVRSMRAVSAPDGTRPH